MSGAELQRLEALLERAVDLSARERLLPPETLELYACARDLVHDLAVRLPSLPRADRERVELNADLPQLSFHLAEELAAVDGAVDREALARSLTFLTRHLVRLRAEYLDRTHTQLDPVDLELVTGLARLTREVYERRFAAHYLGYRRPFVDKLYRDYALTGLPDGLLLELAGLAERDDLVLCVLKGGLPYTLLLELCGLPAERVAYVVCGRTSGSHLDPSYTLQPLGFELDDLRGRSVLVVDNNAATGATLSLLAAGLREAEPARMTLFLDQILAEVASLDVPALERLGFAEVRVGPFARHAGDAHALKRRLVVALAPATESFV